MRRNILTYLVIFLSIGAYAQKREMFVQRGDGSITYKIKEGHCVKANLANRQKAYGKIKILNDSEFYLNKDTIHIDSVVKILRIKKPRLIVGHSIFMAGLGLMGAGYALNKVSQDEDQSWEMLIMEEIYSIVFMVYGIIATPVGILMSIPCARRIDGDYYRLVIKTKSGHKKTKTNSA